jgi:hypothetical protein
LWRVVEPFHQLAYRSPAATDAFAEIGLTRADHIYFGQRVAALGPVGRGVAVAVLYGFDPDYVGRAIPDVWTIAPPEAVVSARRVGAARTLDRILGAGVGSSAEMVEAADIARAMVEALDVAGRPLAAAHADLGWPDRDAGAGGGAAATLWHACTVLREHRGDAHWAATSGEGIDSVECHVLHAADGAMPADLLQRVSGRSDDDWAAAVERLERRGLVDADRQLTERGRATKLRIEWSTDRAAAQAIAAVGEDAAERLRTLMRPWTIAIMEAGVIGAWTMREQLWRDLPEPDDA